MDYEKMYKEALERAKQGKPMDEVFPELAKSEDDIFKEVLHNLIVSNDCTPSSKEIFSVYEKTKEDCLAWLEKQGEKKPVEWSLQDVKNLDDIFCAIRLDNALSDKKQDMLIRWLQQYCPYMHKWQKPAEWSVFSAKKGDILSDGNIVLIFDSIDEFEGRTVINSWYHADSKKFYGKGTSDCDQWETDGFRPASEAEKNYLFKVMNEAGYTWDVKSKVLEENPVKGEQKPADKVEPKIHIEKGQWYVCIQSFTLDGNIVVTKGRTYKSPEDNTISGEYDRLFIDKHDGDASKYFRPWTIEDAKDGDVLVASDGSVFLFKCTIDCACKHYVALTTADVVKFNEELKHYWETSKGVHPATKEQRDLLFSKIKEAGYEWYAEKKELKKIGQNLAWSKEDNRISNEIQCLIANYRTGDDEYKLCSWIDNLKDRVQPQQEWSDEDVKMLLHTIILVESCSEQSLINEGQAKYKDIISWLKSLQNKVPLKPKQEWSEEDEVIKDIIEVYIEGSMSSSFSSRQGYGKKEILDWLKSIEQKLKGE